MPGSISEAAEQVRETLGEREADSGYVGLEEILESAAPFMPLPELVGKREAAKIYGKLPTNLARDIPDLPAPEQTLAATPVWRRAVLEQHAADRAAIN